MKALLTSLVIVIVFAATGNLAGAQTATTTLRGIVNDPTGAVLVGATVSLRNLQSDSVVTKKTDGQGEYIFSPIEPNRYQIKVSRKVLPTS
jgi:hypothetical protein